MRPFSLLVSIVDFRRKYAKNALLVALVGCFVSVAPAIFAYEAKKAPFRMPFAYSTSTLRVKPVAVSVRWMLFILRPSALRISTIASSVDTQTSYFARGFWKVVDPVTRFILCVPSPSPRFFSGVSVRSCILNPSTCFIFTNSPIFLIVPPFLLGFRKISPSVRLLGAFLLSACLSCLYALSLCSPSSFSVSPCNTSALCILQVFLPKS